MEINVFKSKLNNFNLGKLSLFMLVGVAFTIPSIIMFNDIKIPSAWSKTSGTVIKNVRYSQQGSTIPVVEYRIADLSYQVDGAFGSSNSPAIGTNVDVAYNPSNPAQSKLVEGIGSYLFMLIFAVIGIGSLIGAPILYLKSKQRSRMITELMQNGVKITGVLSGTINAGGSGQRITKIIVSATDPSGVVKNYESDTITGAPGIAMVDLKETPIPLDVYIDPANHENYYVDISSLPSLNAERIKALLSQNASK